MFQPIRGLLAVIKANQVLEFAGDWAHVADQGYLSGTIVVAQVLESLQVSETLTKVVEVRVTQCPVLLLVKHQIAKYYTQGSLDLSSQSYRFSKHRPSSNLYCESLLLLSTLDNYLFAGLSVWVGNYLQQSRGNIFLRHMTKKEMTLIYYYVPEDKDDPEYPNVFGIMIPKTNIKYQDIEKNFPLNGQYIFRFKIMHDNNLVWLDLADKNSKLPTYKDKIYIKATRITWDSAIGDKSQPRREEQLSSRREETRQQPPQNETLI